ncbi:MAG: hypothetical protein ACOZNI_34240 [Myxococcota bacterium]
MDRLEAALKARHDLGKYAAFQVRWIGPDAPVAELREALRADLLRTQGDRDVAAVWRDLRGPLAGCDVDDVDTIVATLAERAARLDSLGEPELRETASLALSLGGRLKALVQRLTAASG